MSSNPEINKPFDTVLKIKTELVPKKTPNNLAQKNKFIKIVNNMQMLYGRSGGLISEFELDFSKYDSPFFELVDNVIELSFGKPVLQVIHFYLFDRINPDGSINFVLDKNQNPIYLENIDDLWNLVNHLKKEKK